MLEAMLPAARKAFGPTTPTRSPASNNLAAAYFDAGRIAEAIALHEETLTI